MLNLADHRLQAFATRLGSHRGSSGQVVRRRLSLEIHDVSGLVFDKDVFAGLGPGTTELGWVCHLKGSGPARANTGPRLMWVCIITQTAQALEAGVVGKELGGLAP